MKETYIIEIESKNKSDYGIVFMREYLSAVVLILNHYRKCYSVTMRRVDNERQRKS